MRFDRASEDQREKVLTGGGEGPISAAPLRREVSGGVLIEKVEKREGMRGRRRGSPDVRAYASVLEALGWIVLHENGVRSGMNLRV